MKNNALSLKSFFPALLVILELMVYLSNDMYLPAQPAVASLFHITASQVQYSLTAWFLGSMLLQLLMGPLVERFGKNSILLIGGGVFVLASLLCAVTHYYHLFLLGRFFQGTSVCTILVSGYAIIHGMFEQKQAIKVLALMGSITILAPAFGPLIGVVFLKIAVWPLMFLCFSIVASLALLGMFFSLRDIPDPKNSTSVKAVFLAYKNISKNWGFMQHSIAGCLLLAGIIAWITSGPFLITQIFHKPISIFAWSQLLIFGAFLLGMRLLNKIIDTINIKKLVKILYIPVIAIIGLTLIFLVINSANIYLFLIIFMGYAACAGILLPVVQRLAIEASTENMGYRMAFYFFNQSIASVLASGLVAIFAAHSLGFILLFIIATLAIWIFIQLISAFILAG